MLRASRARPPARSTACAGSRRELLRGRRLHRHRPPTARPCRNDDAQESQASAIDRMASRDERRRPAGHRCSTSTPSAARPAPYGSDPAQSLRRRRHGVARHDRRASAAALRWMQPWFGAGEPRPPARRVRRGRLRPELQERSSATSEGNTQRIARARADRRRRERGVRILRRRRVARRERRQHVHHRRARPATIPVERGVLGIFGEGRWNAGDRATVTAGVRGERITRDALPGDPLAFQPRPDFPEETINSVNPKIAASFRRRRQARALRGSFGTGIRPPDAFEIAFTDNSGLKPERSRSGEFGVDAGARRRRRAARRHRVLQPLHRSDHLGRPHVLRRQPLPHRQHLERAGARRRARRRRGASPPASTCARNYTFLDTEILAVNGSSQRAGALRRRRSAAAPPAPSGIDRRVVVTRGRSARSRRSRCAARRSTPSRRSDRAAASTRTPATPSSTSADRGGR